MQVTMLNSQKETSELLYFLVVTKNNSGLHLQTDAILHPIDNSVAKDKKRVLRFTNSVKNYWQGKLG